MFKALRTLIAIIFILGNEDGTLRVHEERQVGSWDNNPKHFLFFVASCSTCK